MIYETVIDLSRTLEPGVPGFEKQEARTRQQDGWNASSLRIYSHAGTHMDAPLHFDVSDQSVDRLDLNRCIAEGVLLDATDAGPGALIPETLVVGNAGHYRGKALLIHTGWSKYMDDAHMFRNSLPRIGPGLAGKLVKLGISVLGVEPPSVADVNNLEELTEVHEILLKSGIIIVEGLCNLEMLRGKSFTFMALPLKIKDGDGSPVRAVAIIHE